MTYFIPSTTESLSGVNFLNFLFVSPPTPTKIVPARAECNLLPHFRGSSFPTLRNLVFSCSIDPTPLCVAEYPLPTTMILPFGSSLSRASLSCQDVLLCTEPCWGLCQTKQRKTKRVHKPTLPQNPHWLSSTFYPLDYFFQFIYSWNSPQKLVVCTASPHFCCWIHCNPLSSFN